MYVIDLIASHLVHRNKLTLVRLILLDSFESQLSPGIVCVDVFRSISLGFSPLIG